METASGEIQRICPKFASGDTSSQMDMCELHMRLRFSHSKGCLRVGTELAYTKNVPSRNLCCSYTTLNGKFFVLIKLF